MLRPVGDKIVVLRDNPKNKTKGGLHIPDGTMAPDNVGKVVAVGPGMPTPEGTRVEMECKVGDRVHFGGQIAIIMLDDVEHCVLRESNVLAIESK